MNPFKEMKNFGIEGLHAEVNAVNAGLQIVPQLVLGDGSGIYLDGYFGIRCDLKQSKCILEYNGNLFRRQNGRCPTADIDRVKHQTTMGHGLHLFYQAREIIRGQRKIGNGIKIAISAFFDAKGDVDV